ncbi:MAG: 30S ribosomal protein S14 [Caldisphaera sp.]|jgi:small subunit ribosomal protein S14|uniref:30S ribosomal protein S14 n=1 Tax=Caldisphaera sp. TaxID=2060322 RepID=UPI000CB19980|nr:30S ribosomal protein S14 [Caldisphaera sp.]PMP60691.1 MAG: 30S ribosomal protein S14 [Caldisphaera sp.]PMP89376.1 MAG: 30S ribosomal protein S14 [Caldisphaera sp.]
MGKYKPPKVKSIGRGAQKCQRCGTRDAVIQKYGIYLCRQCFREVAPSLGFKKYK